MQTLGHGHSQSLGHGSLPSYSYTQGYPYHGVPIVSGSLHNSGAVPIPILSTGSASSDGSKLEGLSGSVADGREAGGNGEKSSKPISISASANGKAKKRGVDYRCESCAKVRLLLVFAPSWSIELLPRSTAIPTVSTSTVGSIPGNGARRLNLCSANTNRYNCSRCVDHCHSTCHGA